MTHRLLIHVYFLFLAILVAGISSGPIPVVGFLVSWLAVGTVIELNLIHRKANPRKLWKLRPLEGEPSLRMRPMILRGISPEVSFQEFVRREILAAEEAAQRIHDEIYDNRRSA